MPPKDKQPTARKTHSRKNISPSTVPSDDDDYTASEDMAGENEFKKTGGHVRNKEWDALVTQFAKANRGKTFTSRTQLLTDKFMAAFAKLPQKDKDRLGPNVTCNQCAAHVKVQKDGSIQMWAKEKKEDVRVDCSFQALRPRPHASASGNPSKGGRPDQKKCNRCRAKNLACSFAVDFPDRDDLPGGSMDIKLHLPTHRAAAKRYRKLHPDVYEKLHRKPGVMSPEAGNAGPTKVAEKKTAAASTTKAENTDESMTDGTEFNTGDESSDSEERNPESVAVDEGDDVEGVDNGEVPTTVQDTITKMLNRLKKMPNRRFGHIDLTKLHSALANFRALSEEEGDLR